MLPASGCFINPVMVGNRCSSGDYRAGFSCRTDGTPKLRSDKFATIDDTLFPFDLPIVARKKVSAAFGGWITSDGGVMLLAQAERRLGIAGQLARVIPDERHASRVTHLLSDILRARIFAIACGYEDADDLDRLRFDPALTDATGDPRSAFGFACHRVASRISQASAQIRSVNAARRPLRAFPAKAGIHFCRGHRLAPV
jgi:Transposase DDE domain group 1